MVAPIIPFACAMLAVRGIGFGLGGDPQEP
jgi:hypothetical protein